MTITAFVGQSLWRRAVTVCILASVCVSLAISLMIKVAAQAESSPSRSLAQSAAAIDWKIVFLGYPQVGVPRSGAAVITSAGLSNFRETTFAPVSGELSPDGRFIAYDNCATGDRGIYLAGSDGTRVRRLVSLIGDCVSVRWSLDGKRLSYSGPPDYSLHILDLTSEIDTVIPNSEGADWHWWSPAGDEIVYGRTEVGKPAPRLLYITDLKGKNRPLTFAADFMPCELDFNTLHTWAPAWSPKGDVIAFTQCGSLFIVSPNGKNLRQMTTYQPRNRDKRLPETFAYSPRWSPDGEWIVFIGEFGRSVLKRISPNDNKVVVIGQLPHWGGPFSIAPLR